ncbi:T9SS type A sorting domain-containing protein [Dyadobacter pollutisoli]|uniref:T9SS type A sorting domain-containing protein n=1 Tax=Dyadobacter pollutisoli TaxID=2910158 RepID=A0A9E8NDY4_9BACT|nr:T9SS type A sorting domain-containing protein [Dyadobacter pollutisoli]WAC12761.1 T9SS type A sorting domain-containing protein [Dyadobacter pollutisoli]
MKRYLLFCQLALLPTFCAFGQMSAGTDGFFVAANTPVAIDGLTLNPTADFFIDSRTLVISPTAIPGTPPSITRVYNFSTPVDFVGNVGLFFQTPELNGNTESTLQVAYGSPFVTTTGSTVNTITHYVSNNLAALTSLTSVTAAQPGALPVTLIGFRVNRVENTTMLYWQTSEERNSDFFEIQQSADTRKWNSLGTVKAATESRAQEDYSFQDAALRKGIQYYRLKMVDVDGSFAYSAIRNIDLGSAELISAYPNPVVDKLRIGANVELVSLKVTDLSGRSLLELSRPKPGQEFSLKNYAAGTYLVQIKTADGKSQIVKIVKQ